MIKSHQFITSAGTATTSFPPNQSFFFGRVLRFEATNPQLHISTVNNILHVAEFTVAPSPSSQLANQDKKQAALDVIPNLPEHANHVKMFEFEVIPGYYLPGELADELNKLAVDRDLRFTFAGGLFSVESQNKNSIEIVASEQFLATIDSGGRTITRCLGFVSDAQLDSSENPVVVAQRRPRCPYSALPWFDVIDERQFNRTHHLVNSLRCERGQMISVLLSTDKSGGKKLPDVCHIRLGAPGMPAHGYACHEFYIPRFASKLFMEAYNSDGSKFPGIVNLQIGFVFRGGNAKTNNSKKTVKK